MTEKSFHEMSLDEVFNLERQGSFHIGRTVVTASGLARRRAKKPGPGGRSFATQGSFKIGTAVARNDETPRERNFGDVDVSAEFHVVNDGEKWTLKRESSQRALFVSHSGTKQDVVRQAVRYLKNRGGGSLKIHNRDGSIQEERTFPKAGAVRVRS